MLIAPGHGIHATKEFAQATRPQLTLCSVFPRYAKTIPAPKVFKAIGSQVFVTGIHGQLQVTCDGNTYQVKVEHPEETPH